MYRHPYLYGLSEQPDVEDAQKRCSTTGQVQARDFSHEYVDRRAESRKVFRAELKTIAQGIGICYNLFAFGDMKNLTFFVYVEVTYDIAAFAYYMLCPLLENPHAAC